MNKYIIISLLITNNYFCQNTNIDLESINNLWSTQILNTSNYQNGDSIYCYKGDLKDFISINRPAYTIHNGIYFYNWRAVNDDRKILPNGYVIPSINQFKKLNNFSKNLILSNIYTKKSSLVDPSKTFYFLPAVGYVDEAGFASVDENSQTYWTDEKYESNIEFSKGAKFFKNENTYEVNFEIEPVYSDNGLPILYIQDINSTFKSRIFSYDSIMPLQYKNCINSINQILSASFKNEVRFNIDANIEFGSNGINKSIIYIPKVSSISVNELADIPPGATNEPLVSNIH